jgi:hypothetical protein
MIVGARGIPTSHRSVSNFCPEGCAMVNHGLGRIECGFAAILADRMRRLVINVRKEINPEPLRADEVIE